jgi:hypothetical protein
LTHICNFGIELSSEAQKSNLIPSKKKLTNLGKRKNDIQESFTGVWANMDKNQKGESTRVSSSQITDGQLAFTVAYSQNLSKLPEKPCSIYEKAAQHKYWKVQTIRDYLIAKDTTLALKTINTTLLKLKKDDAIGVLTLPDLLVNYWERIQISDADLSALVQNLL